MVKRWIAAALATSILMVASPAAAADTIQITVADIVEVVEEVRQSDEDMLARLVYLEARGVKNEDEQAAVIWCVLNRVDHPKYPNTIAKVVTQKGQFAYKSSAPLKQRYQEMARDVLTRWRLEKLGYEDVGRTLPKEYLWFAGRGGRNWFRDAYKGGRYYDFTEG